MAIKVLNEFLPVAEEIRLGGVKVGDTLSIDDGVLNTNAENIGVGGNRLTHVPRHFTLTLSSGTITVPKDSEIWYPDGFESDETTPKFTKVVLSAAMTKVAGGAGDGTYMLLVDFELGSIGELRIRPIDNCISGSIAPSTSGSWAWYDTTENLIKIYDGTTLMSSTNSLPLAKITVSSGTITKINMIYNAAGFIGGMVYTLPGIHGSIPYHFQIGTANPQSLNFETEKVLINQVPNVANVRYTVYLNDTELIISDDIWYDGQSNMNKLISNIDTVVYAAKTSCQVYCGQVGKVTEWLNLFVEASAYEDYREQTMPYNFNALTYLNANKGNALVGQKITNNGAYVPFLRQKSTNGVFIVDGYQNKFEITYTSDATINANLNQVTHSLKLLDEDGNTAFPGNVAANGVIEATTAAALWADLAEKYVSDVKYPIGTLVCFGGENEITIAKKNANGVISEKPGFVLNKKSKGQPVALIGKTKVRVIGLVNKGDKLVLYKDGIAKTKKWYDIFKKTIGIAIESNNKVEEKLVMSVVHLVV